MIPDRPAKPSLPPAAPAEDARTEPADRPIGLRRYARPATMFGRTRAVAARAASGGKQGALSGAMLFVISNMAYFAAAAIVPAHLLFAAEEHPLSVRLLTAIPAVLLVFEARGFLKDESREVPFVVLALFQYYAAFCFGVFFELKFFDLFGPVNFTAEARLYGGIAVALGAVSIWGGAHLGRHVGRDLQRWVVAAMPPAELPERWDSALLGYVGVTVMVTVLLIFVPSLIPGALTLPATYAFALEMALGLSLVAPSRKGGALIPQVILGVFLVTGVLRGTLESIFRGGIAYMTGRWVTARAVSFRIAVVVVALYALLQPVKASYRQQVWAPTARTGQSVGFADRLLAWESAFSDYFSGRYDESASEGGGRMERLSEFSAVMHAFDVIPGRVAFIDGEGLLPIFYAPIPRFLWANKPTTRDTVQRYAIIFGRQTEEGARSTAINLPLLVEGYWNFGWPGIVLVTAALGFWVGLSQKVFAGEHWALRATGIANITNLTVAGPVVYVYSSVFQTVVGRAAVCWAVYWLATMLSRRRYDFTAKMHRAARR